VASQLSALERLEIRVALEELNTAFCYHLDHDEVEALLDLFTDDVFYTHGPRHTRGKAELEQVFRSRTATTPRTARHMYSGLKLELESAARARGTSPSKLTGDLFTLLKESGSVYTGRSWGEFVSSCVRASEHWTAEAVDDALDALLAAESAFKETRLSSDEQLLASLLPRVCGAGLRRRVARAS